MPIDRDWIKPEFIKHRFVCTADTEKPCPACAIAPPPRPMSAADYNWMPAPKAAQALVARLGTKRAIDFCIEFKYVGRDTDPFWEEVEALIEEMPYLHPPFIPVRPAQARSVVPVLLESGKVSYLHLTHEMRDRFERIALSISRQHNARILTIGEALAGKTLADVQCGHPLCVTCYPINRHDPVREFVWPLRPYQATAKAALLSRCYATVEIGIGLP